MQSTWYFALTKKLLIPLEKIGEPGGGGGGGGERQGKNFKCFDSSVQAFLVLHCFSLFVHPDTELD